MMLPMFFYTVLSLVLSLFFGVTGLLILARSRRVPRARGILLTASALMFLYALWSATVRIISLTYPPIVPAPGETPPELSPVQAFNYEVLQPVWHYANVLLVVAVVVLLVVALPRSRAEGDRSRPGPAGPPPHRPGPHQNRPGPHPAQPYGGPHRGPHPQGPPQQSGPPHGGPQGQPGPPSPQYPPHPQAPQGPQGPFPPQQQPPAPPKRPGRHRAPGSPE